MTRDGQPNSRTLSPASILEMLNWRFDAPYAFGAIAYDAYFQRDRNAVCLEFVEGPRTHTLALARDDGGPAAARACGLRIGYTNNAGADPSGPAKALCDEVARQLRQWESRQRQTGQWQTKQWQTKYWQLPKTCALPPTLEDEVRFKPLGRPPAKLLARDLKNYEALYRSRPLAGEVVVRGESVGISVHYPTPAGRVLPASAAIYEAPARIRQRRRLRLHFASLGCLFDAGGMPRTVPTPVTLRATLRRRMERFVPMRWVERRGGPMDAPEWVEFLLQHRALPVTLAPPLLVTAHRLLRRVHPAATIPVDVGMLVHDASVHGLVFSDIDADLWDDLAAHARTLLRRGRRQAFAVARFYEEELTQACWRCWRSIDDPREFSSCFEHEVDTLRDALRRCAS